MTMKQDELRAQYDRRRDLLAHLRSEALFALESAIGKTSVKIHSITSRIKTFESLSRKAQLRELDNPLLQLNDLVGLRVVCLFLSDITRISDVIKDAFAVTAEDNKIEQSSPSSFGYMSVHFIVTMKDSYSGPRYDPIAQLPFEIQIRTIAMDAWANVSHHLSYKSERDVPSDLKRDFYALSGLFYVADKHFELFYGASLTAQAATLRQFEKQSAADASGQPINADTIAAYATVRFPEREVADPEAVSDLVQQLLDAKYQTIGDVDRVVTATSTIFEEFERRNSPDESHKYTGVGAVRTSINIADPVFHRAGYFRWMGAFMDRSEIKRHFADDDKVYEEYRSQFADRLPKRGG